MPNLKPQDLLVALKLVALDGQAWTYAELASQLEMSVSQLHSAVKRALVSGLLVDRGGRIVPSRRNLLEFLAHGVRYSFPPERGSLTRGMPTAHGAKPLSDQITTSAEPPPVWPTADGAVRGVAFSPIYHLAPAAAENDERLYPLLALVDAVRGGSARERKLAVKLLEECLNRYALST